MLPGEPFTWIEIDIDGCDLTFGVAPCPAALAGFVTRKCYNTRATCRAPEAFSHTLARWTMRLCSNRVSTPKGATWFPVMAGMPSEYSASVNIAGSDQDLSAFGRRATVTVPLVDIPYHDRFFDPYQTERQSGAAQTDEPGYDPATRGTLWSKLKQRWVYYAGRPMRVCNGRMVNGVLVTDSVRHYIITNLSGPDDDDGLTLEGADVLDLADDKRTAIPRPSRGKLLASITNVQTTLTLTPVGIGDAEYTASGKVCLGSEIMEYTRVGDTLTVTRGTNPTTHAAGTTVQQVLSFVDMRVDDAVYYILTEAGMDPSFWAAENAAEVTRWLPNIRVNRDVTKGIGAKTLLRSLVVLGFSLFWDSAAQKVRLKANRPLDNDVVHDLDDRTTNIAVTIEEDDSKRLTHLIFYTVQADQTKSDTDVDNYLRATSVSDLALEAPEQFNGSRVERIFSPWINQGADSVARVAAKTLLFRFAASPKFANILVDFEVGKNIQLTDVIRLTTRGITDETGKVETLLWQVIWRSEPQPGERISIRAQRYQFTGRFPYATANGVPTYLLATTAQRDPGFFACDPVTLRMPNGDPPYEAI